MNEDRPITRLLDEWRNGDADALDQVMALVYDDLRDIAARVWQGESRQVTLEPSAIVHEAYLRLVQLKDIEWLAPDDAAVLHNAACNFGHAGHGERALELMERRLKEGGTMHRDWLEHDPDFARLRDDPRFIAILDRLPSAR